MAYCIAAVDGQITNNEWEAIKEGLSFVNLSPDTFNGSSPVPGMTAESRNIFFNH